MRPFSKIALILLVALAVPVSASAQFSVDWGVSNDTGNFGFDDLDAWFDANGYGAINAQTDYIGFGGGDADPFFFAAGPATFEIVSQLSGSAALTSFGFYTGTGFGKSLTEVLAAGATGPTGANPAGSYGVYMNTPTAWNSPNNHDWFTDRAENLTEQTGGDTTNAGGDPQALIYKLADNDYLIAWEDLDYTFTAPGQSDRDFNDTYLKLSTSPTVTPEPISSALFLLGGGALAAKAARRRTKKTSK